MIARTGSALLALATASLTALVARVLAGVLDERRRLAGTGELHQRMSARRAARVARALAGAGLDPVPDIRSTLARRRHEQHARYVEARARPHGTGLLAAAIAERSEGRRSAGAGPGAAPADGPGSASWRIRGAACAGAAALALALHPLVRPLSDAAPVLAGASAALLVIGGLMLPRR